MIKLSINNKFLSLKTIFKLCVYINNPNLNFYFSQTSKVLKLIWNDFVYINGELVEKRKK